MRRPIQQALEEQLLRSHRRAHHPECSGQPIRDRRHEDRLRSLGNVRERNRPLTRFDRAQLFSDWMRVGDAREELAAVEIWHRQCFAGLMRTSICRQMHLRRNQRSASPSYRPIQVMPATLAQAAKWDSHASRGRKCRLRAQRKPRNDDPAGVVIQMAIRPALPAMIRRMAFLHGDEGATAGCTCFTPRTAQSAFDCGAVS